MGVRRRDLQENVREALTEAYKLRLRENAEKAGKYVVSELGSVEKSLAETERNLGAKSGGSVASPMMSGVADLQSAAERLRTSVQLASTGTKKFAAKKRILRLLQEIDGIATQLNAPAEARRLSRNQWIFLLGGVGLASLLFVYSWSTKRDR